MNLEQALEIVREHIRIGKGMEIDRIGVNGNYNPSNCQFITHKENCGL